MVLPYTARVKKTPFLMLAAKSQSHFPATPFVKTQATTTTAAHLQWLGNREHSVRTKACLKFPSYERGDLIISERPFGIHSPTGTQASLRISIPENGRRHNGDKSKPSLSVLARGSFSRPGFPHPEVLVPVLAQLDVGVAAQRLQEATRHSAERWQRTPPLKSITR